MAKHCIVIFGASGGTGRELVKQGLERDFHVKAFLRDPAKLPLRQKNLSIIKGDVRDRERVADAIQGCDAVLSALGAHSLRSQSQILEVAVDAITTAMKNKGLKRIVVLTDCGLSNSNDNPSLMFKLGVELVSFMMPPLVKDARKSAEILKKSQLDWTIVRVPFLTNGNKKPYVDGYVGKNSGIYIARSNVADFMLNQIDSDTYVHDSPFIATR